MGCLPSALQTSPAVAPVAAPKVFAEFWYGPNRGGGVWEQPRGAQRALEPETGSVPNEAGFGKLGLFLLLLVGDFSSFVPWSETLFSECWYI